MMVQAVLAFRNDGVVIVIVVGWTGGQGGRGGLGGDGCGGGGGGEGLGGGLGGLGGGTFGCMGGKCGGDGGWLQLGTVNGIAPPRSEKIPPPVLLSKEHAPLLYDDKLTLSPMTSWLPGLKLLTVDMFVPFGLAHCVAWGLLWFAAKVEPAGHVLLRSMIRV